jgi:succinate dehydrogenase / fumarate reductase, cytochrome b subunit
MSEAAGGKASRPLSPHLMAWRPHLTMVVSITHRFTGMALYVGVLIVAGWAAALASGPDAFEQYRALLGSILGKLVLIGLTFSIFYHLAGGIRHLGWDLGYGFEKRTADTTATAVIAFAITATIAVWVIAGLRGLL